MICQKRYLVHMLGMRYQHLALFCIIMLISYALLGGKSKVSYSKGQIIDPVRVLANGRATRSFAGKKLDL